MHTFTPDSACTFNTTSGVATLDALSSKIVATEAGLLADAATCSVSLAAMLPGKLAISLLDEPELASQLAAAIRLVGGQAQAGHLSRGATLIEDVARQLVLHTAARTLIEDRDAVEADYEVEQGEADTLASLFAMIADELVIDTNAVEAALGETDLSVADIFDADGEPLGWHVPYRH